MQVLGNQEKCGYSVKVSWEARPWIGPYRIPVRVATGTLQTRGGWQHQTPGTATGRSALILLNSHFNKARRTPTNVLFSLLSPLEFSHVCKGSIFGMEATKATDLGIKSKVTPKNVNGLIGIEEE